jgi:putative toxin-antitoxin system antitoxin component (TIGR02293 family)
MPAIERLIKNEKQKQLQEANKKARPGQAKRKLLAMDSKAFAMVLPQKPTRQTTAMEKWKMVKEGVTKKELEQLKQNAGLDYDTLARGLSTGRATLINKKGKSKFNLAVSEKIVGLADIYSYGYEVFEEQERFNKWMFRPNKALGNHAPYDLVNNQFGREEVKNLIGRIDYGVYA